jgi:fumarylacetoacetate (FAA) hydrolase
MRLASLAKGGRDGSLAVISADGNRYCNAANIAPTLQAALESWGKAEAALNNLAASAAFDDWQKADGDIFAAPLPRAWQWLDGSAFPSHGALMDKVIGIVPQRRAAPLMYQGMSDRFYGPTEDVALPGEDLGIDFEGEFGVIVDAVPMGISADDALHHIKLVVLINDWSLRTLAGPEMKTGFGWIQAKPASSMAPFAVTPDELGAFWANGRVCLDLAVDWNGEVFGRANGREMEYGFHDLVAHAARTRALCAGTVIGSGTVSNANFRQVGSSCIAERRGIEIVDEGAARTSFMRFGDRVRMEAFIDAGRTLFGAIDQRVVPATRKEDLLF